TPLLTRVRRCWPRAYQIWIRRRGCPLPQIPPSSCLKTAPAGAFKTRRRAEWTSRRSSPEPAASPGAFSEDGWQLVKAPYWWRAMPNYQHSKQRRASASYSPPTGRSFVHHRFRICHRCLDVGHCKIDCRNPFRCRVCKQCGHCARDCNASSVSSPSVSRGASPSSGASPAPPTQASPPAAMPLVGDPSLRPEEGHVVITSTPAMEDSAATFSTLGAMVWLGGNRPRINTAEVRDAIATNFVIDRNYIKVVPHYPEDFFVLFSYQHHRDLVTASSGRFSHGGLDFHTTKCSPEALADLVEAYYHVHLCIENLPLNAWCDEVATQMLGPTLSCTTSTSPLSREKTPPPSTSGHGQPTPPPFPRFSG
uniref:CCHC-type domain-containing protein n=1 Tax=Aegilops tauschii subsp. strangulata TaxID=200361 RepID=A0A453T039_AEGTS